MVSLSIYFSKDKSSVLGLFVRNLILNFHDLMFEESKYISLSLTCLVSSLYSTLIQWKSIPSLLEKKKETTHMDYEKEKKEIFEKDEPNVLHLPLFYSKYNNEEYYHQSRKESLNISYQKNDEEMISILKYSSISLILQVTPWRILLKRRKKIRF
jgi:hypothetical protein